jgi:hypothetical protein
MRGDNTCACVTCSASLSVSNEGHLNLETETVFRTISLRVANGN